MKDYPFLFTVVPHEDRAFSHHLEVGPLPSYFVFSSVLVSFLRADEELGSSREVLDLFKTKVVKFTCIILKDQYNGDYPLGIYDLPNAIDLCIVPFS